MSTLAFYAQFTKTLVGVNSLTVTWDVEQITRSDGTRSALVTGGATSITIGRRGLYGYLLASADTKLYDYVATAITAGDVDQKEIAALWTMYEADTLKVSGDGTAADNLELFFDGTGYASAGSINSVSGSIGGDVAGKVLGGGSGTITGVGASADVTYSAGVALAGRLAEVTDLPAASTALNAQETADAVNNLAPAGAGAAGSVRAKLDAIGSTLAVDRLSHHGTIIEDAGGRGDYVSFSDTWDAQSITPNTAGGNNPPGDFGAIRLQLSEPYIVGRKIGSASIRLGTTGVYSFGMKVELLASPPQLYGTIWNARAWGTAAVAITGPDFALGYHDHDITPLIEELFSALPDGTSITTLCFGVYPTNGNSPTLYFSDGGYFSEVTLIEAIKADGLTKQDVADALALASADTPATGSVYASLDTLASASSSVLDEPLADHNIAGTAGAKLNDIVANNVTVVADPDPGALEFVVGVTFDHTLEDLVIPSTWTMCYLTLKSDKNNQADSASLIQVKVSNPAAGGDGLLRLKGSSPASPITVADASLVVSQAAGTVRIIVSDDALALLTGGLSGLEYDLKVKKADGSSTRIAIDEASIEWTPTRAV